MLLTASARTPAVFRTPPVQPRSADGLARSAADEVAVIDEIQMLRDPQRGWAWTRALLGVAAEEVHLCGEPAALELIQEIALCCGEEVEVRRYKRLSPLVCEDTALETIENVRPGDCVVCFSKNDIYQVSREIGTCEGGEVCVGGGPGGSCDVLAVRHTAVGVVPKILLAR